ncbi:MAG: ABC transporter substrate-binding protein [Acidimicrobiales bacterium]
MAPRGLQGRHFHYRTVVALALTGALLAACSSTPSSSGTSGPGGGGTISLGIVGPDTGSSAAIGVAIGAPGFAAVYEINAAGGILGRKVKGVTIDDTGDPADAVPNVEKAIATVSNFDFALGIDSNVAATVVPLLNRARIPMMSLNGLSLFIHNKYPYFWRMTSPDVALGSALGIFDQKLHFSHPAILTQNDSGDQGNLPGLEYALQKEGVQPVENVTVTGDQSSYLGTISSTIAKHPDSIIVSADTQTTAALLKEYKSLNNGKIPPMISPTENIGLTFYKALVSSAGSAYPTKDVFLVGGYVPSNTVQYNLYMRAIQATGSDNPGGKPIPQAVAQAVGALYDGGIIMALAMDMSHSTKGSVYDSYIAKVSTASPEAEVVHTYAAGLQALKQGKRIDYVGVDGQAKFNRYNISVDSFGAYGLTTTGNTTQVKAVVGGPELAADVPSA